MGSMYTPCSGRWIAIAAAIAVLAAGCQTESTAPTTPDIQGIVQAAVSATLAARTTTGEVAAGMGAEVKGATGRGVASPVSREGPAAGSSQEIKGGGASVSSTPDRRAPADSTVATPRPSSDACIRPSEASRYYGRRACVRATVLRAVYRPDVRGSPTFIDLSEGFSVVIWGTERSAFRPPPESQFPPGTVVEVTGVIEEYRGHPEIIVSTPSQVRAVR